MQEVFSLSNGISVVAEYIDYAKTVSAGVWVYTGSAMENKKNNGVSHFIEHMLFKGTETRTAKEIAACMDAVGGHLNAVTAREYTCYYTKILTEHTELALELLSDMLMKSTFTQDNVDVERKVIVEELNMDEDDPEELVHDILCSAMWKDEPLGLPIAGTTESVASVNRDTIINYYNENYIADKIVISIVGNFDYDKIRRVLEEKFGGIARKGAEPFAQKKISPQNIVEIVKKDVEQCQLCIGFDGYSRSDLRNYDLAVVNALLGGNMSSRLFQKVREELGLAYSIYSFASSFKSNGSLTVCAGLNPENLIKALDIIGREIKKLRTEKLTFEEVETAKTQFKASVVMGSERISARMNTYGKSLLFDKKIKTIDDIIGYIDNVNLSRVADVIDSVFDKERMTVAVLGRIREDRERLLDAINL